MGDILFRIREKYHSFTKAEKKVADYVLNHPEKVVYQSIGDLAVEAGVGETSVFRFCRDMNQKGYQDFKLHVAQAIAATCESAAADQLTGTVHFTDTVTQVVNKLFSSTVKSLQVTAKLVNGKNIEKAVNNLIQAQRIHFFGVGGSMIAALEAQSRFMRLTPKGHFSIDPHMQLMEASLMTQKETALVFSFSGETKDTIDIARKAKEGGGKIIVITGKERSALSKLGDIILLCGADEGPLQGGSMAVKGAQLFLLD
ncbi:MAG: MurR/RpiR family transcriptional regulator, partial [Clostridiales bacterium]|nr:MurR/RpiR family transcriptional regulator [Clostridiales bacterium]